MDEVARVREAASRAVDNISPSDLQELVADCLQDAVMTPGVLTLLSAELTSLDCTTEALDRRAAGVQLIYNGLSITRELARSPPWDHQAPNTSLPGDLEILAADVFVARGFYLLARTEAALKAVETVQQLGRTESSENTSTSYSGARPKAFALEADVFELAIIAGVTATGREPPANTRSFATSLTMSLDGSLPSAPDFLSEPTIDALSDLCSPPGQSIVSAEQTVAESTVTDP